MTAPVSVQVHSMYQRTYRRVPVYWQNRDPRSARYYNVVESLAGQQVQLTDPWDKEHTWMLESTALNYPIQATGADQKYLAISHFETSGFATPRVFLDGDARRRVLPRADR